MLLMCFCSDNVLSRWTPRYLTDVLKGTLFPPMLAHSLSTDSRQDAEPTGITSHPEQNIINTCLNTGLNRKELIGWGTFGQLSVIGVLVIVTIMDRNHIWQRVGIQRKQDRSQHGTLGHAVHKRAGGGHNTINNDWLKTATQVGDKPVEDCTPNTKACFSSIGWSKVSKAALRSSRATRETSLSSVLPTDHQGHLVRQSLCYGFACKRTERFQEIIARQMVFQLNQDNFLKNLWDERQIWSYLQKWVTLIFSVIFRCLYHSREHKSI